MYIQHAKFLKMCLNVAINIFWCSDLVFYSISLACNLLSRLSTKFGGSFVVESKFSVRVCMYSSIYVCYICTCSMQVDINIYCMYMLSYPPGPQSEKLVLQIPANVYDGNI